MRALVAALCLVCLDARASDAHPGARPGEAFTFKFSVGAVDSGRARMSVGPAVQRGARRLVSVHGQAETSKWLALLARIDDDYRLTLDANTLLPTEVISVEHGMRERTISSQLDGRTLDLTLASKQQNGRARRLFPRVARDPLTALFAARAAPLHDGDKLEMLIIDGLVLWRTRLTVRREPLRLSSDAAGRPRRPSIRLDGENQHIDDAGHPTKQPPRHFTVWLSDDADRVLLRMEADIELGRAALELTSYLPARAAATAATPQLPGLIMAR